MQIPKKMAYQFPWLLELLKPDADYEFCRVRRLDIKQLATSAEKDCKIWLIYKAMFLELSGDENILEGAKSVGAPPTYVLVVSTEGGRENLTIHKEPKTWDFSKALENANA